MYMPTTQPVAYENILSMAFVDGYITVMNRESLPIKKLMLAHLQEVMEEGEMYSWPAVRAYHAALLQYRSKGGWHEETRRQSSSCDGRWSGIGWCLSDTKRLLHRDTHHKPPSGAPTHIDGGRFSAIPQSRGTRRAMASTKANAHPTQTTHRFYMFAAIVSDSFVHTP